MAGVVFQDRMHRVASQHKALNQLETDFQELEKNKVGARITDNKHLTHYSHRHRKRHANANKYTCSQKEMHTRVYARTHLYSLPPTR